MTGTKTPTPDLAKAQPPPSRRVDRPVVSWPRLLGGWALLLPGVITFQPVFGGMNGYGIPLIGVSLGVLLGLVAYRFRWSLAFRFASIFIAYFLIGGPLVVPRTTVAGFFPTLETMQRLVFLVFQSWRDILTVATPAGSIPGPAAMPLLAGLIIGVVMTRLALKTRLLTIPPMLALAWLMVAIAFGVRAVPTAIWLGAALGVGILAWFVAHQLSATSAINQQVFIHSKQATKPWLSRVVSAGLVALLAAGGGIGYSLFAEERVNRQVLRDDIEPPLDLHEFASPLMKYRLYELTQQEDVLFTVEGMPEGSRLRLAVMDTYDGNVFNVSQQTDEYMNVGHVMPWTPSGERHGVTITADGYSDVWLPTFGETTRIDFSGENAKDQAASLYYNRNSHQALTTGRFVEGDAIDIEAIPIDIRKPRERDEIKEAGIGTSPLADVTRVPDILTTLATEWASEETSAYMQLQTLAERLRAEGFYSNGSDNRSRSGHTAERLGSMFAGQEILGDDEQYATAMALMATQLGIPARVVMGFHPLEGEPPNQGWEVLGDHAHVWVEADLDGFGWVPFDPTPDRDKVPETIVPQPQPKPKPQVDPPPEPPERIPEDPLLADDEPATADEEEDETGWDWGTILMYIGIGVGSVGVLSLPFLTILLLKVRRRKRRSSGPVMSRLVGAWDEVVDQARDVGYVAPSNLTRREVAADMQAAYPSVPAVPFGNGIDASVFGHGEPSENHGAQAWDEVGEFRKSLLKTKPWYARPRAVFSLRSLRRRKPQGSGNTKPRQRSTKKPSVKKKDSQ